MFRMIYPMQTQGTELKNRKQTFIKARQTVQRQVKTINPNWRSMRENRGV